MEEIDIFLEIISSPMSEMTKDRVIKEMLGKKSLSKLS